MTQSTFNFKTPIKRRKSRAFELFKKHVELMRRRLEVVPKKSIYD